MSYIKQGVFVSGALPSLNATRLNAMDNRNI